jgi:acetoin utilization deacetylase AcuC-like enzyme
MGTRFRYTVRVRVFFSPHYSFPLGPHPFPMGKYARIHGALLGDGTLREWDIDPAPEAAEYELLRVHTADYFHRLRDGALTPAEIRRLGFPWSPELVRRALHATGGTLRAALAALRDGVSSNIAGGSHHAFPDHGEGYCALHDMAVAVRALHEKRPSLRVALVDLDVHQGNGSAAILGDDPRVYTLSLHCEKNYPLRKVPGSRDVGLANGVGDAEYLRVLERELDLLWSVFRPELVLYQAGVDTLAGDRLGRLALTRPGLRRRDAAVLRRCLLTDTPVVTVVGGGYHADEEQTVQAHADVIRAAHALYRGEPWPPQQ